MQVSLLVGLAVVFKRRAEPAAMLGIMQRTAQGGDAMIDQRRATGDALYVSHGEAVSHARGVHRAGGGADHQASVVIEAAKTVFQFRRLGETQQAFAFQCQPLMMGR